MGQAVAAWTAAPRGRRNISVTLRLHHVTDEGMAWTSSRYTNGLFRTIGPSRRALSTSVTTASRSSWPEQFADGVQWPDPWLSLNPSFASGGSWRTWCSRGSCIRSASGSSNERRPLRSLVARRWSFIGTSARRSRWRAAAKATCSPPARAPASRWPTSSRLSMPCSETTRPAGLACQGSRPSWCIR